MTNKHAPNCNSSYAFRWCNETYREEVGEKMRSVGWSEEGCMRKYGNDEGKDNVEDKVGAQQAECQIRHKI
jgi:hypothetical protein